MRPDAPGNETSSAALLPDLCQMPAILRVVMATELGALLFTLIHSGAGAFDWQFLALCSLFMLWIGLSSAALLCACRHWLARRTLSSQARMAYALVIGVTLVHALLAELVRLRAWGRDAPGWFSQVDGSFLLHCGLISAILGGVVLHYLYLQHQSALQARAGLEARVQALQARIRPHFLFNSMNSIAGLIPIDPQRAEEAVIDLAELFRSALQEPSRLVLLRTEIEVCERYLRIEKLRLGERLTVTWDLASLPANLRLPPLCLQPLVENAIYHGIQPSPAGGELKIRVYLQQRCLYIEVTNPLPAVTPAVPEPLPHAATGTPANPQGAARQGTDRRTRHQGNHLALDNIRSRLQAFYGERAALKTSRQESCFTAVLRIPIEEAVHDAPRVHRR